MDGLLDPVVTEWLSRRFALSPPCIKNVIQIHTELTVLNEDAEAPDIIRAHPSYRGHPWNDYVQVNYGEELGLFPARCALVFEWPAVKDHHHSAGDLCALVQEVSPDWEKRHVEGRLHCPFPSSMLLYHCYLNSRIDGSHLIAELSVIEASSITRRIFAVNPDPASGGGSLFKKPSASDGRPNRFDIVVAKDRESEWTREFLSSHTRWRGK